MALSRSLPLQAVGRTPRRYLSIVSRPTSHFRAHIQARSISTTLKTPLAAVASQHVPTPHNPPPQPPNFSPQFTFGAYQATGTAPVARIRYPKFQSLESE